MIQVQKFKYLSSVLTENVIPKSKKSFEIAKLYLKTKRMLISRMMSLEHDNADGLFDINLSYTAVYFMPVSS